MSEVSVPARGKLSDFDYRIFERLRAVEDIRGQRVLIAVSGGLDSIALAHSFLQIAPRLELEVAIAHCHHGTSESTAVVQSRAAAEACVREFALKNNVSYFPIFAPANADLKSEAELREFRLNGLSQTASENGFAYIAFAHHSDDLLETRLLRLIRGTSGRGLSAMAYADTVQKKLRPFLFETRGAIEAYAQQSDLRWIEDPSNSDTAYLRNFIRREWLPALEAQQNGASKSLARSLETLAQEAKMPAATALSSSVSRQAIRSEEIVGKRALLANYLAQFGVRDFTQSRIDEVLKRLGHLDSTGQKHAQFQVGGLSWEVTVDFVQALPQALAQDAMLLTQDDRADSATSR